MRSLIFVVFLCLIHTASADCDCLWEGAFADVQHTADLVVSGTVIASKGNSVDVAVEQLMRGSENKPSVRVWLKASDYCRPPVDTFPIGTQWVMALHQITEQVEGGFNPHTPNVSYGRVEDYRLSSCGGFWLQQIEDRVTGNLIAAPRWDHNPKMTPVLIDLVTAYANGQLTRDKLLEASKEDPALRELMLDTRAFLRNEN